MSSCGYQKTALAECRPLLPQMLTGCSTHCTIVYKLPCLMLLLLHCALFGLVLNACSSLPLRWAVFLPSVAWAGDLHHSLPGIPHCLLVPQPHC
mmetsp:Transcript_53271/g.147174  ORF Transcript_53271/g.147174 Transcript_53271/m.147174 type:complete len:94 (+) Transcript_53271:426-707(+)